LTSALFAARLARDGKAEPIQIVETAAAFAIEWKGSYRINGPAFVYSDRDTGRVIIILGYPTDKLVDIEYHGNAQHRSGGKFQICS
jgi:hypothetical protein